MSLPKDHPPDPLVASVLRTADGAPAGGCPDADVLGLYAERELTGEERASIDSHVAGCGRCQATVAAFVRSAPEPVAAQSSAGVASSAWWAGWRWMLPLASATAVLAVAVWIGRGPADEVAEQARATEAAPATVPGPMTAPKAVTMPETASAPATARVPGPADAARALQRRDAAQSARLPVPERRAEPVARERAVDFAPTAPAESETAAAPAREDPRLERAEAPPPPAAAPLAVPPPTPAAPAKAGAAPRAANAIGALGDAAMATFTGTVTDRTRQALPPGAVIEVRLLDVSRAGAAADTIARTEIVTGGEQVPVPFTLAYDATTIQPRRTYVVQATITVDGRVAWRTTTPYPVFVEGMAPTRVDVVVDPVR